MIGGLQNLHVGMDARLLDGQGQGASTYATALREAQLRIAPEAFLLTDVSTNGGTARGRLLRWSRAMLPFGKRARRRSRDSEGSYHATDIYRLAQVWFDIHHRLMPIRLPGPPGIIHWAYPVPLRVPGWRNVYTVHDAIPLIQPQLTSIDRERHRLLLDRITGEIGRGGAIVTVSEAARAEVADALHLAPDLITNCGMAVERRDDPVVRLPERLLPGEYLLVCGTVEARKNSLAIVEAYRRSGVTVPLVLAGPPSPLDSHPAISHARGVVRLVGLDQSTITALIARARAVLMPSLAEGFGLPVAEAVLLGTAVLTSNSGALAETAGDAALLVDPGDVSAIASAIARLATDPALRASLVAKGHINARRFTAERFADRLAAFYGRLVAGQE